MDSSPPSILNLPYEILHQILSFAVPSIKPEGGKDQPEILSQSPFHAVRSTCRTFRHVVDELPFWMHDDFNIAEINHSFPTEEEALYQNGSDSDESIYADSENEFGEDMSRLKVLLSDRHLQGCLRGKMNWFCDSLDVLETLQQYIPRFGSQVRQLKLLNEFESLDSFNDGTSRYIDYLIGRDDVFHSIWRIFPILTVLQLRGTTVHLKFLPRSLQKLGLNAPLCSNCRCKTNSPISSNSVFLITTLGPPLNSRRCFLSIRKPRCKNFNLNFRSRATHQRPLKISLFCTNSKT
jgi:hypothetical protein